MFESNQDKGYVNLSPHILLKHLPLLDKKTPMGGRKKERIEILEAFKNRDRLIWLQYLYGDS